ncbi:hypothetical protein BDR22DRAFT_858363 [Usnea florida]
MFRSTIVLVALLSISLPLANALKPLDLIHTPITTAPLLCPTATETVKPHRCFKNAQVCPQYVIQATTTVPCGCPSSGGPTTTVTRCRGCQNVRYVFCFLFFVFGRRIEDFSKFWGA